MNPGKLKHRIEIWHDQTEESEFYDEKPTPALLARVWANIESRTGSLLSGRPAGTMLSKTTAVIDVRREVAKKLDYSCYIFWTDAFGIKHRFDIDYISPVQDGQLTVRLYVQEAI